MEALEYENELREKELELQKIFYSEALGKVDEFFEAINIDEDIKHIQDSQ